MGLDPGGVPLRVRSQLSRLRPESKEAIVAVRDRLRPPHADRFQAATEAWLDGLGVDLGVDLGADVLLVGMRSVPLSWPRSVLRLDPYGRGESVAYVGPLETDLIGRSAFDVIVVVLGADAADLVGAPSDPAGGSLDRAIAGAIEAAVDAVRPGGLVAIATLVDFGDRPSRSDATVRPLVDELGPVGEVTIIAVDSIAADA